jgi:RNA polymerase sigma-70 factor (TIGR02943 family)
MTTTYSKPEPTQWVQRYANELYRYALTRVYDQATAEDLVSDTFLAAYRALKSFEQKSSEKTWLYAILKNKIIDFQRKRIKHLEHLQPILQKQNRHDFFEKDGHWKTEALPNTWQTSNGEELEKKEFYQTLHSCLSKLPEQQRIVFTLKLMEDKDAEEICEELNISSSNFWVIMHRVKLVLRGCLEKNWFAA